MPRASLPREKPLQPAGFRADFTIQNMSNQTPDRPNQIIKTQKEKYLKHLTEANISAK